MRTTLLLGIVGLCLLFAVSLQGLAPEQPTNAAPAKGTRSNRVEKLRAELTARGWRSVDLAANPFAMERTLSTLQLDQFVNLEYKRGGAEVSIYVGYWSPGRWDPRFVDEHTPLACWPAAGWKLEQTNVENIGGIKNVSHGVFVSPGGARLGAFWWHLVGGRRVNYNRYNIYEWWRNALDLVARGEALDQYFVRVSVDQSGGVNLPTDEIAHLCATLTTDGLVDDR